MKDRIEQYLVKHGLIKAFLIKHFRSNTVPNELTNETVSSHSEELLRDLTFNN
jgi:hypothetical protein